MRITRIMKIIELHSIITKNHKNYGISYEIYENRVKLRITHEDHKKNEKNKIQFYN